MAKLNEQDFKRSLTSEHFSSVYLIYGEEKYLVKHYTTRLCEKVTGKKPSDFDYVKLSAGTDCQEIMAACEQFPLFSRYKCVVVSDYRFDDLSDSDSKQLLSFCEDISPSTVLIFTMPTLSVDTKKSNDKKSTKLQKFITALQKCGTVLELPKRDDIALERQLISWAEKNGCSLSMLHAAKIISLSGTDMTTLHHEMAKLCAYANGQEITEDMIRLLIVKNTEVRIFDLSDQIMANNYQGAYKQLYNLFEQNEKPEIILSVLSSVFIDMYRAKVAAESGQSLETLANDLKYGRRSFLLKNASTRASRYSTETLRRMLQVILEADIKLKSKPSDKRILLETLLAKLLIETKKQR